MKKYIKSLTVAAAIFALSFSSAKAIDASFTVTGATITNLVSVGCRIYSLTILNNGAAANTFGVVDSPSTNSLTAGVLGTGTSLLVYSNGAYMGISSYLTNITKVVTNYYGLLQTNITITNMLATVTNTVAPVTNSFRVLYAGSVGAGPGTLLSITNSFSTAFGLTVTNSSVGTNTYFITYSPNF